MQVTQTKVMCNTYIEDNDETEDQQTEKVGQYISLGQPIFLHDSSKVKEIKRVITLGY